MSLKCMIDKWLYKGQISQEEYDAVIKKLDGHDKQIRADAIEEFEPLLDLLVGFESEFICDEMCSSDYCDENCKYDCPQKECYLQYIKMQKGAENE